MSSRLRAHSGFLLQPRIGTGITRAPGCTANSSLPTSPRPRPGLVTVFPVGRDKWSQKRRIELQSRLVGGANDMSTPSNQARAIFLEAIAQSEPEKRAEFIALACGADADLRARVERLLRSHELLGSFHDAAPAE